MSTNYFFPVQWDEGFQADDRSGKLVFAWYNQSCQVEIDGVEREIETVDDEDVESIIREPVPTGEVPPAYLYRWYTLNWDTLTDVHKMNATNLFAYLRTHSLLPGRTNNKLVKTYCQGKDHLGEVGAKKDKVTGEVFPGTMKHLVKATKSSAIRSGQWALNWLWVYDVIDQDTQIAYNRKRRLAEKKWGSLPYDQRIHIKHPNFAFAYEVHALLAEVGHQSNGYWLNLDDHRILASDTDVWGPYNPILLT